MMTCLRLRFEERGSWSKALEDVDKVDAEGQSETNSPAKSPQTPKTPKDKAAGYQRLTVPAKPEDDSSSSNGSTSPRKLRSKLSPLAWGYASAQLELQQSDRTASGFWARALGGNDLAKKLPGPEDGGLAMTARPLKPLKRCARAARGRPPRASYYFELEAEGVLATGKPGAGTLT
ncbi:unnamed protein product [Effrenium voratum]|nr:unnamed protein product [Effrenium voratum]